MRSNLHKLLMRPSTSCIQRKFSTPGSKGEQSFLTEEAALEAEADKKFGWLLKLIFAGTATAVAYNFFPYMGDNLVQQSISLLQVEDPYFKRTGASRLARFATNDANRLKIVELGGEKKLVRMLETAEDDLTRKAALLAMAALCGSDESVRALFQSGAASVVNSSQNLSKDAEIESHRLILLKKFHQLNNQNRS